MHNRPLSIQIRTDKVAAAAAVARATQQRVTLTQFSFLVHFGNVVVALDSAPHWPNRGWPMKTHIWILFQDAELPIMLESFCPKLFNICLPFRHFQLSHLSIRRVVLRIISLSVCISFYTCMHLFFARLKINPLAYFIAICLYFYNCFR